MCKQASKRACVWVCVCVCVPHEFRKANTAYRFTPQPNVGVGNLLNIFRCFKLVSRALPQSLWALFGMTIDRLRECRTDNLKHRTRTHARTHHTHTTKHGNVAEVLAVNQASTSRFWFTWSWATRTLDISRFPAKCSLFLRLRHTITCQSLGGFVATLTGRCNEGGNQRHWQVVVRSPSLTPSFLLSNTRVHCVHRDDQQEWTFEEAFSPALVWSLVCENYSCQSPASAVNLPC